MVQVVSRRTLSADAWVRYQASICETCGEHGFLSQYFCTVSITPHTATV